MKYWKGIKSKAGQFGTMEDNGTVPDSIEATQEEYNAYVSSMPVISEKKTLKKLLLEKSTITQAEYDEVF